MTAFLSGHALPLLAISAQHGGVLVSLGHMLEPDSTEYPAVVESDAESFEQYCRWFFDGCICVTHSKDSGVAVLRTESVSLIKKNNLFHGLWTATSLGGSQHDRFINSP